MFTDIVDSAKKTEMQREIDKRVSEIRGFAMAALQSMAGQGCTVEQSKLALIECEKLVRGRLQKRMEPLMKETDAMKFSDLLNDYAEEPKATGIIV